MAKPRKVRSVIVKECVLEEGRYEHPTRGWEGVFASFVSCLLKDAEQGIQKGSGVVSGDNGWELQD